MSLLKYALPLLLAASPVFAATPTPGPAVPPSDVSLRELLQLTQSQKMVDGILAQTDAMMQQSMQQLSGGQALNDAQRKVLDDTRAKLVAEMRRSMNWEQLEPKLITIYQKSFTQEEVDGLLAFYRSPTGQALIAKMPVVMQHSMELMQEQTAQMMPRMREIQSETAQALAAAKDAK
jgi:hypothetical protein